MFNVALAKGGDNDIDGRIVIIDEMVPLCTGQNKLRP